MKKMTYDIEWDLERFHWWFVGRRKLLKFLISSMPLPKDIPVIDIGCGVGSNLTLLKSLGFRIFGMDSEIYSLSLAKKNSSAIPLINGDLMSLPFKTNSIGLIVATDILEHLDEDTLAMKEIHRTLIPEGKVLLTVPAFRFLWGIQDMVGMHRRRYSKMEFVRRIEHEGLEVLRSSYFNFLLFFPILIGRRIIHLLELRIESENKINSPFINFLFTKIFSLEPHILRFFSFPFGVSIFCIAKKD
jgi:SAM-dependent methyltransferase